MMPRVETINPLTAGDKRQAANFDSLKHLLTGVGVAGTLAVVGYVSSFARDEFLGVRVEIRSGSELTFAAGQFAVQTLLLLLQQARAHYIITMCVVVGIVILYLGDRLQRSANVSADLVRLVVLVTVMALGLAVLTFWDLPVVRIHDAMITGLGALPGVGQTDLIDCRTNQVWELLVDSRRLEGSPDPISAASAKCIIRRSPSAARTMLESIYILNTTFCVMGWLIVCLEEPVETLGRVGVATRVSAIMVILICTLFVPYVFGKCIRSTTMPKVDVSLRDKSGKTEKWEHAFLISEAEKSIIVIEFENSISRVVEVQRENVERINISGTGDALAERISLWSPDIAPLPAQP
jgi:hypothetical protein